MSKSDDNTKELESYGVWVKNTTENEPSQTNNQADEIDTEVDDMGLDLPDFDDTDFSDMFKDDSQFTSAEQDDTFGGDSTLSTDELANITDIASEPIEVEENFETAEEPEPIFDEVSVADDDAKVSIESGEEEISLDDFLDGGFSDESVASGNNGYEPGAEKIDEKVVDTDTEELSLDDFLDGDSFEEVSEPKDDTVTDETPIDMDISFDDSIESIETEENQSLDNDDDYEEVEENESSSSIDDDLATEEVSFDDFDLNEDTQTDKNLEDSNEDVSTNDTVDFDTEEIDLSDFGIDSDAEETPIVQDVETQKNKEEVVDYDLFIGNETTSSAPVVNEIKVDEPVQEEEPVVEEQAAVTEPSNTTAVDNSLLQQIVADLSSLKDEINTLKTNIAEIKANENVVNQEITIPEEKDQGGFFNSDDTDETIALSGDELSNIMNNADFGDSADEYALNNEPAEVEEPETIDVEPEVEAEAEPDPEVIEEPEEFDFAETTIDETEVQDIEAENDDIKDDLSFSYEDNKAEEPTFDNLEQNLSDASEEELDNVPDEISIPKDESDIFVESTNSDFMDSVKDSTEEDILSTDSLEEMEEVSSLENEESFEDMVEGLNIEDENLEEVEEAGVEDAEIIEEIDDFEEDGQTDEIKLPSVEDIENDISNPAEPEEETVEAFEEDDEVPTVDMLLNNNVEEQTVNENETADFSPSITDEETEALTSEDNAEDDFNSVDNLNDDLSTSNIDYLTSDEEIPEEVEIATPAASNNDLKQEIKSVLLYMDQLLENLPEDKIYEFAKSDEFTTYKKLFKDLGLS